MSLQSVAEQFDRRSHAALLMTWGSLEDPGVLQTSYAVFSTRVNRLDQSTSSLKGGF